VQQVNQSLLEVQKMLQMSYAQEKVWSWMVMGMGGLMWVNFIWIIR
jgi:hypothetical protein